MTPAFKEWSVIIEALGAGEQIVILRKGGIAENQGGFQVEAGRFWLFPTHFHAQREKTKPAAAAWFSADATTMVASGSSTPAPITVRFFAEVVRHSFLDSWPAVAALDRSHFWTEAAVREKFDWSEPAGLHAVVVRVHRLKTPLTFRPDATMAGCKSWIALPEAFAECPSTPVLDDDAFLRLLANLPL